MCLLWGFVDCSLYCDLLHRLFNCLCFLRLVFVVFCVPLLVLGVCCFGYCFALRDRFDVAGLLTWVVYLVSYFVMDLRFVFVCCLLFADCLLIHVMNC